MTLYAAYERQAMSFYVSVRTVRDALGMQAVTRAHSALFKRYYVNGFGGPSMPGQLSQDNEKETKVTREESRLQRIRASETFFKMLESAATTIVSLTVLGLAGYGYHRYYKYLVLQKMQKAFEPGDPMLELARQSTERTPTTVLVEDDGSWIRRSEQEKIDRILNGTDRGHYHLLIGEKGTGKSSMLLDAMQKVNGEGISMLEAHADLEIFRIRLGKALDYEFHEDYIGSLFSIRGPRDTTALLDIERAFNKLEKIALKRRNTGGGPLVLIINSTHLLRDDEDGQDLLELVQQRAEQWAASNLVTVVLNSDDYWVYERLKQYATRMEVLYVYINLFLPRARRTGSNYAILPQQYMAFCPLVGMEFTCSMRGGDADFTTFNRPVLDLPKNQAVAALATYREKFKGENPPMGILEKVYDRIGGRLSYLNQVARSSDMIRAADEICQVEKTWFLNKCWILGEEMDDDVMDQQKYASAAMVLAKALVDQEQEVGAKLHAGDCDLLPQIPLHRARQIMTRADFIKDYDHINIFTIDAQAMVRADSVPMMNAFREICNEEGFEEHLQATLDRISAIESLGRTREIVAKDLVAGAVYKIKGRSDRDEGITVQMKSPD